MATPYDYGFRPWTDVIENTGNDVGRGIDAYQARQAQVQAKDDAEKEQNRALHPAAQKWLRRMISGELTPEQAANGAHSEIDSLGTPSGPPLITNQTPESPANYSNGQLSDGPEIKTVPTGPDGPGMDPDNVVMGAPARPGLAALADRPRPQYQRPLTVRDMNDAVKMAPLMQAARPPASYVSPDEWTRRETVKTQNKGTIQTQKDTAAGERVDAGVAGRDTNNARTVAWEYFNTLTKAQHDMELDMIRIRALERSPDQNDRLEVEKLKSMTQEKVARINEEARQTSAINMADPLLQRKIGDTLQEINNKANALTSAQGGTPAAPGTPGAATKGPEYRPQDMGSPKPQPQPHPPGKQMKGPDGVMREKRADGKWHVVGS